MNPDSGDKFPEGENAPEADPPAGKMIHGDALRILRTLPSGSVHCCVTSPPYWGLRDYSVPPTVWGGDPACAHAWQDERYRSPSHGGAGTGGTLSGRPSQVHARFAGAGSRVCAVCGAWEGCLGLEPTPERYVEHLVLVFREVRRVLRDDGTLWLNLGDTYSGSWGDYRADRPSDPENAAPPLPLPTPGAARSHMGAAARPPQSQPGGLPRKNLVGIPWRVAFALQSDGWVLRTEIVWSKPNGIPESVTDRPTRSHEYVFLLTKKPRYFYDAFAAREPCRSGAGDRRRMAEERSGLGGRARGSEDRLGGAGRRTKIGAGRSVGEPSGRNRRTVWEVATSPFAGAHFATFPERLVEPCVLAGTSERGCCASCGAPLRRVVGKGEPDSEWRRKSGGGRKGEYHGKAVKSFAGSGAQVSGEVKKRILEGMRRRETLGWVRGCPCPLSDTLPCLVLDPFAGSGTTGLVAKRLGRRFLGIDLNPGYVRMAERRVSGTPG